MSEKDQNQRFRTSQKMAMVAESWRLSGEELVRFLRNNGISSVELESWREQMKDGMDDGKPLDRQTKKRLENRIAQLEKELKQAEGMLVLQKKVGEIWDKADAAKAAEIAAKSSSRLKK